MDYKKLNILEIILELNLKNYEFNNIFEKNINFKINKIALKTYENIKKRLSFCVLFYNRKTLIYEITIENLCDFNIKKIAEFDSYINLPILSEKKL